MKVAMLGTGFVARALGKGFVATGHAVTVGTRDPKEAKVRKLVSEIGHGTQAESFRRAAEWGDLAVLCVLGEAAETVARSAGESALAGKTVIDTTNPLDFGGGMPPKLFVGHTDSLGERVQRSVPRAHVVKAFNIVGNSLMFRPKLPGGVPDMFYCGNDAGAKKQVADLLRSFGWKEPIDIGGIEGARLLEPMCLLWVLSMVALNDREIAFKLLRSS